MAAIGTAITVRISRSHIRSPMRAPMPRAATVDATTAASFSKASFEELKQSQLQGLLHARLVAPRIIELRVHLDGFEKVVGRRLQQL